MANYGSPTEAVRDIGERSVNKGKRGILRIIFGRTGILVAALLLEGLLLFWVFMFLARYIYLFFGGYLVFGFLILLIIINRTNNPNFQLAWATLVLLFPLVGGLFYLYIELQPGSRLMARQMKETEDRTANLLEQDEETIQKLEESNPRIAQLTNYIDEVQHYPVYRNTQVTYFPTGEDKFEELLVQLKKAKKFIFLEYFILTEGFMWDSILDVLKEKVGEGVEVRLLYDGMDELTNVPHDFSKKMQDQGIKCRVFCPIRPMISTSYNYRDHRKIVVIDGNVAFTGGANIGDEYINRKERFGHWKDAAIMLKGEAVKDFTLMFLQMWDCTDKAEDMTPYLKDIEPVTEECEGFVQPYAANPLLETETAERMFLEILNSAVHYVHIMTPYLIPDHEMIKALIFAAQRGVDVELILPHIPDKKYAFALAHSYYKTLIRGGVKIYEYTPGFIHSKVFVSDDIRAVVGTINLDFRSLYLNFECAAYLYEVPEIAKIEEDFETTLPQCQLFTEYDLRHDRITRRAAGYLLKLIAPLM